MTKTTNDPAARPKPITDVAPAGMASAPARTRAAAKPKPQRDARVIADVAPPITPAPSAELRWYWCGSLPDAHSACPTVAGIEFPNRTAMYVAKNAFGKGRWVEFAGCLLKLSDAQLEAIAAKLKTKVVRWARDPAEDAGVNVGDKRDRPQGMSISIPSEADVEAARAIGNYVIRYVPQASDRPLSDYLFMAPVEDPCPRPVPFDAVDWPLPLSKTGIVFSTHAPVPADAKVKFDDGRKKVRDSLAPLAESMLSENDAQ